MKEIIYKGKKVKVPFEDANYTLDIMILESLWFYVCLFVARCIWLYLTA